MKQASLFLNVALLIAVGFLYYLHFSERKTGETIHVPAREIKPSSVVFINSDSLLNNYVLYKRMKSQMEEKGKKIDQELSMKGKKFEEEVQSYQQKASSGALSRDQAQAKEEELRKKQQDLVTRRDELTQQLSEEEHKLTEQLYKNITEYLRKYSKSVNYKFVLGYTKGASLWYANDSLDITTPVLTGLNKELENEKK